MPSSETPFVRLEIAACGIEFHTEASTLKLVTKTNLFPPTAHGLEQSLKEIYPRYSKEILDAYCSDYAADAREYLERTERAHYRLEHSFSHSPLSEVDRLRVKGRKVVCMSLFLKPASFHNREEQALKGSDGNIVSSEFTRHKYPMWKGTPRENCTFVENYLKVLESDFGDWVPVVFLAADLTGIAPVLLERDCIVLGMHHDSIAHNPGAMWRFLGFNFDSAFCFVQDTDRLFNRRWADRMVAAAAHNPQTALVRKMESTGPGGEMPLILGNNFLIRPACIDFDVRRMMTGYLLLNILHEDRLTNLAHEGNRGRDDSCVEPLSRRLKRPHFGPLPKERVPRKCYPYYGFDEQWLKEFVYYHLSNGRTITLLKVPLDSGDRIQALDAQLQQARGNAIIPWDETPAPTLAE
jgi:hypothetical protein